MKRTFKESFDIITEAYIKGEIKPMENEFCICGNLCNNDPSWNNMFYFSESREKYIEKFFYTHEELKEIEMSLFLGIKKIDKVPSLRNHKVSEEAMFNGMCEAIEIIRGIHEDRGENTDLSLKLTKRNENLQRAI